MTTDLDRLRTDAIIAIHKASDFDYSKFIEAVDKENLTFSKVARTPRTHPKHVETVRNGSKWFKRQ